MLERTAWFPPTDDRSDPFCTTALPNQIAKHARLTCYLIGANAVSRPQDGLVQLHHLHYGSANSLCEDEPFWCQPTVVERHGEHYGSFGYSGLLIGPRHVLTCWHGWTHFFADAQLAIFDYYARSPCDNPTTLPASRIYRVRPYPSSVPPRTDAAELASGDWVILELERSVEHLQFEVSPPVIARPQLGRAVYTLGYPCGLPLKLASNATILHQGGVEFRTDLDTFSGNSGSPVFDAETHALVGIVVQGQKNEGDFEASPSRRCYVSNRVDSKITGQICVSAEEFSAALTAVAAHSGSTTMMPPC
ncbi:MAG: serine protease [Steroidobacteraceae bacterium]|nr:serine protease [Steroidobacteraceae bacterium]MDW8259168.1 serine protease [Gammaproteobacteria bacterium]